MWTKLYGERNTNTNYLGKLLELNVEVGQLPGVVPKSIFRLQNWLPGDERVRDWYFAATFRTNLGWKHASVKSADELLRSPLVSDKHVGFITVTKTLIPGSFRFTGDRTAFRCHGTSASRIF